MTQHISTLPSCLSFIQTRFHFRHGVLYLCHIPGRYPILKHMLVYLNLMYVMQITCKTSNQFRSYIPYKLKYSGSSSYPGLMFMGLCIANIFQYTGCPTRYRTQHFFNNSNINDDIATKQTHTTDTFLLISHTTNVLLFKFRCNIFIGVRSIKEMPGWVVSGTPCINKRIT
jgi:hypothetical protein